MIPGQLALPFPDFPNLPSGRRRCPARESGGYRCELVSQHSGEHWISDRTISRAWSRR